MIFDGCGVKQLATQGILTYCTTRSLPYHLYADGSELFVLMALVTSVSLSKKIFLTDCKTGTDDRPGFYILNLFLFLRKDFGVTP